MKFAIIGYGVVGSGVAEVFYKNRSSIERKAGRALELGYILDLRSLADTPYADKAAQNFEQILADPDVGVVIETIGGLEPAYTFSRRSLAAGKHVVTSNKELVAAHGAELLALAREHNVNYLFEASVGGGIPIIHPLYQCLGAGEILEVAGILNGTTNFIMTRMFADGMSFDDALALAQQNGYAEANPDADVQGTDACRKICILASIAFGRHVYPDEVHTEGISEISKEDVSLAAAAGFVLKLIGRAKRTENGKLLAMVSPALIPKSSPLANVSDVFNGILVRGSDTGDVVFYGRGAGKLPTASAVIADVVDALKADGHIDTLGWVDAPHDSVADFRRDCVARLLRVAGSVPPSPFGDVRLVPGAPPGQCAFLTAPLSDFALQDCSVRSADLGLPILRALRVLNY